MSETLYRKNLEALSNHGMADIAETISGLPPCPIQVTYDKEGQPENIDLGGQLLYADGVRAFVEGQFKQYADRPNRFFIQPPLFGSEFLMREEALYRETYETFGAIDAVAANGLESTDAGYCISFGLGLGHHLNKLVHAFEFKELIVCEQYWEFLQLSLQAMDWKPLFDSLKARGGRLQILIDNEPVGLSNRIHNVLRGENFALIDGSYGFQHYKSPFLDQTHQLFREMLPSLGMSEGFFEDELVMLDHTAQNISKGGLRIFEDLEDGMGLAGVSAFVVGSGPSVDQSIETIRANRERSLIISAGTGLGVLLRAGIKPDIHCELENLPIVYEAVIGHKEGGLDFEGIHLFASPTVDPRIPAEFDQTTYVFRDSVTSSLLFADPGQILNTGPTVANFASRIAIGLGVSRIYLFGVDLGAVDRTKHHSDQSVYARSDNDFWKSGLGMLEMDQEVPGNLREKVYSNPLFTQTRTHFHAIIRRHPDCRFFNCSDGARIDGAAPLPASLLQLPAGSHDIRAEFKKCLERFQERRRSPEQSKAILSGYEMSAEAWYDRILPLFEQPMKIEDLNEALKPQLELEEEIENQCAVRLNKGTLMLMLQFGYFYSRRVDEARRAAFLAFFFNRVRDELQKMRQEFGHLIKRLLPENG